MQHIQPIHIVRTFDFRSNILHLLLSIRFRKYITAHRMQRRIDVHHHRLKCPIIPNNILLEKR